MSEIITFKLPALCEDYLTMVKVPGIFLSRGKENGTIFVTIDQTTLPVHCEIEVIHKALKILQSSLGNFSNDSKTIQEKARETSHCLANYLKLDNDKHLNKYIAVNMLVCLAVFMLIFPLPMFVVSLMLAVVIGLITGSFFSIGMDKFNARVAYKELGRATLDLELELKIKRVEETHDFLGRVYDSMKNRASDRDVAPSVSDDSDNSMDQSNLDKELQDKSTDRSISGSALVRGGIFNFKESCSNIPVADSYISFSQNAKRF